MVQVGRGRALLGGFALPSSSLQLYFAQGKMLLQHSGFQISGSSLLLFILLNSTAEGIDSLHLNVISAYSWTESRCLCNLKLLIQVQIDSKHQLMFMWLENEDRNKNKNTLK